ncbi:hypothetical protein SHKM778_21210 [Streptomyces sp. KM77-8]|uniref:ATP-binding protein n=1 Tax=Streptomyces haneummycinicus TaxID=3074435 RepID=A0AAT9HE68_9ACTN
MLGSWRAIVRHYLDRLPRPAQLLISGCLALLTLGFVFPDAIPGLGWFELPVLVPLLSLTALVTDSYQLMASPSSRTRCTRPSPCWCCGRSPASGLAAVRQELFAPPRTDTAAGTVPDRPRSQWPALRDAGQHEAAELLTTEVAGGRANDVDCARVEHAFTVARRDATLAAFSDTVLRQGGAAWTHPSGARDLPHRSARHDLLAGQVRIGRWVAAERAPQPYHDAGAALGPDVLGTSLLAVGPSGSGKTRTLVEPVTEALALQALTGRCAVVAVSAAGSRLGADDSFDVIVRIGDPSSVHDLDPYAESDDPDEAAAILAEALTGDLDTAGTRGAATTLAQLLGPFRTVRGRFPTLPELRELLEGEEEP